MRICTRLLSFSSMALLIHLRAWPMCVLRDRCVRMIAWALERWVSLTISSRWRCFPMCALFLCSVSRKVDSVMRIFALSTSWRSKCGPHAVSPT